jgi:transposase-like protein
MKQVLHGSARTTVATRQAIQQSQESLQSLATQYNLNPKTVAKWRSRKTTADASMGPARGSAALTAEQEALALAFRRHTLLSLDDCLAALQATVPPLTRSTLHRCFHRYGIGRLPLTEAKQSMQREEFKRYPIGILRVDFAEVQTEKGKQQLYVAVDHASKVIFAEVNPQTKWVTAANFLHRVLEKLPYKVHTILTDRGKQFKPWAPHFLPGEPSFDDVCHSYKVKHQVLEPAHCWTKKQVEQTTRRLKEAITQSFRHQTVGELNKHLQSFLLAYNHTRCLKVLRGLTPHEFVCTQWQNNPGAFTRDPSSLMLGLVTSE